MLSLLFINAHEEKEGGDEGMKEWGKLELIEHLLCARHENLILVLCGRYYCTHLTAKETKTQKV